MADAIDVGQLASTLTLEETQYLKSIDTAIAQNTRLEESIRSVEAASARMLSGGSGSAASGTGALDAQAASYERVTTSARAAATARQQEAAAASEESSAMEQLNAMLSSELPLIQQEIDAEAKLAAGAITLEQGYGALGDVLQNYSAQLESSARSEAQLASLEADLAETTTAEADALEAKLVAEEGEARALAEVNARLAQQDATREAHIASLQAELAAMDGVAAAETQDIAVKTQWISHTQAMEEGTRNLAAQVIATSESYEVATNELRGWGMTLEQARNAVAEYQRSLEASNATTAEAAPLTQREADAIALVASAADLATPATARFSESMAAAALASGNLSTAEAGQIEVTRGLVQQEDADVAAKRLEAEGAANLTEMEALLADTDALLLTSLTELNAAQELSANNYEKQAASSKTAASGIGIYQLAAVAAAGVSLDLAKNEDAATRQFANFASTTIDQSGRIGQALNSGFNLGTTSSSDFMKALAPIGGVLKQVEGGEIDLSKTTEIAAASQNLQVAGANTLNDAMKAEVETLRMFHLGAGDAATVSNALYDSQTKDAQSALEIERAYGLVNAGLGTLKPNLTDVKALVDAAAASGSDSTRVLNELVQGLGNLVNGSTKSEQALAQFNVKITDGNNQLLSARQIISNVVQAISEYEPAQQGAAAAALLGSSNGERDWQTLQKLDAEFRTGKTDVDNWKNAENDAKTASNGLQGSWSNLIAQAKDLGVQIGVFLVEAYLSMIHGADSAIISTSKFIEAGAGALAIVARMVPGIAAVGNSLAENAKKWEEWATTDIHGIDQWRTEFEKSAGVIKGASGDTSDQISRDAHKAELAAQQQAEGNKTLIVSIQDLQKADKLEAESQAESIKGHGDIAKLLMQEATAYRAGDTARAESAANAIIVAKAQDEIEQKHATDVQKASDLDTEAAIAQQRGLSAVANALQMEAEAYRQGDKAGEDYWKNQAKLAEAASVDLNRATTAEVRDIKAVTEAMHQEAADARAMNEQVIASFATLSDRIPQDVRQSLDQISKLYRDLQNDILAIDRQLEQDMSATDRAELQSKRQTLATEVSDVQAANQAIARGAHDLSQALDAERKVDFQRLKANLDAEYDMTVESAHHRYEAEKKALEDDERNQIVSLETTQYVSEKKAEAYDILAQKETTLSDQQADRERAKAERAVEAIRASEEGQLTVIRAAEEEKVAILEKELESELAAQVEAKKQMALADADIAQAEADLATARANAEIALAKVLVEVEIGKAKSIDSIDQGLAKDQITASGASADSQIADVQAVVGAAAAGAQSIGDATGAAYGATASAGIDSATAQIDAIQAVVNAAAVASGKKIEDAANVKAAAAGELAAAEAGATKATAAIADVHQAAAQAIRDTAADADAAVQKVNADLDVTLAKLKDFKASGGGGGVGGGGPSGGSEASALGSTTGTGQELVSGNAFNVSPPPAPSTSIAQDPKVAALQAQVDAETILKDKYEATNLEAKAQLALIQSESTVVADQIQLHQDNLTVENQGLNDQIDRLQVMKDETDLVNQANEARIAELQTQSSYLQTQLQLTNDILAASGQTDSTDSALLSLEVQRDQLVINGQNTTEIDKQISAEQARNKLAADQNALQNVGLVKQQAQLAVETDRLNLQIKSTSQIDSQIAKLQLQVQIGQDRLKVEDSDLTSQTNILKVQEDQVNLQLAQADNQEKFTTAIDATLAKLQNELAILQLIDKQLTANAFAAGNSAPTFNSGSSGSNLGDELRSHLVIGSGPGSRALAGGGTISEHVVGVGDSGRIWEFGENGPEVVTPAGTAGATAASATGGAAGATAGPRPTFNIPFTLRMGSKVVASMTFENVDENSVLDVSLQ